MCLKWQICRATMERTDSSNSLWAIYSRWNRNSFSLALALAFADRHGCTAR